MKLSTYFSYEELTQSDWAARHGVSNDPGTQELENLKFTATQLDRVRALLGVPVLVSSGFRSVAVNYAVRGKFTVSTCSGKPSISPLRHSVPQSKSPWPSRRRTFRSTS